MYTVEVIEVLYMYYSISLPLSASSTLRRSTSDWCWLRSSEYEEDASLRSPLNSSTALINSLHFSSRSVAWPFKIQLFLYQTLHTEQMYVEL